MIEPLSLQALAEVHKHWAEEYMLETLTAGIEKDGHLAYGKYNEARLALAHAKPKETPRDLHRA